MSNLFSLLILIVLACSVSQGHRHGAYYYDSKPLEPRTSWMGELPDNVEIRRISIPGTHDSGAYQSKSCAALKEFTFTQRLSIKDQLEAGIRYLDIRCRHINNAFAIHHGSCYLDANFDNVLTTVANFLATNPTETVLMVVKEEHTPEGNTREFEDTFAEYFKKYNNLFWNGYNASDNPTLGKTRGKVVLIQRFDPKVNRGLTYNSFDNARGDDYNLGGGIGDLYGKWEGKKANFDRIRNSGDNSKHSFITHLSGSSDKAIVFPYTVASGHIFATTDSPNLWTGRILDKNVWPDFPRGVCFFSKCNVNFEGLNILAHNYMEKYPNQYFGIIVADFPGAGLINTVIKRNIR